MSNLVSSADVAKYVLTRLRNCTHMKLQKLLYYCQAWSLVWDDQPLFSDRIEAWANGPVIPGIYQMFRGEYYVNPKSLSIGEPSKLTQQQKETIDAVLTFYGDKGSQWLSDLTHMERPWIDARDGLAPGERCNREISHSSMAEYYGSL